MIGDYIYELIVLLGGSYLKNVEYGFRRNGCWILALSYSVNENGNLISDSRAGGVYPNADVTGATFFSHLTPTSSWWELSSEQQNAIRSTIPIKRVVGHEPGTEGGYWVEADRSYESGGVGVVRRTYRPW